MIMCTMNTLPSLSARVWDRIAGGARRYYDDGFDSQVCAWCDTRLEVTNGQAARSRVRQGRFAVSADLGLALPVVRSSLPGQSEEFELEIGVVSYEWAVQIN